MSLSLQSILGEEALAAFEAPGAVARGLPAAAYTSEAVFALENERIFTESWVFTGLAHELAQPGDVVPVTVAGKPVLLVRGDDRGSAGIPQRLPPSLPQARRRGPATWGPPSNAPITPGPTSSTARYTSLPTSAGTTRARCRPASTGRAARAGPGAGGDLARLDLRQPGRSGAAARRRRRPAPEPVRRARPQTGCSTWSRSIWARSPRTGSS